jgi:6-phosphofructokinase 1
VTIGHADVHQIANQIRPLPDSFINDRGNGITEAGARYLLPLIAGEANPRYVSGLPYQLKLR